jgi:hypothetical protein
MLTLLVFSRSPKEEEMLSRMDVLWKAFDTERGSKMQRDYVTEKRDKPADSRAPLVKISKPILRVHNPLVRALQVGTSFPLSQDRVSINGIFVPRGIMSNKAALLCTGTKRMAEEFKQSETGRQSKIVILQMPKHKTWPTRKGGGSAGVEEAGFQKTPSSMPTDLACTDNLSDTKNKSSGSSNEKASGKLPADIDSRRNN